MKKFLPLVLLVMATQFLSAQIPNADLELWTNAPNLVGWQTNSYPLTLPPYDPYIIRKDSDRFSGLWAADFYGNGVIKPWATTIFAVPFHPGSLSLYYKLSFPSCVNGLNTTTYDTVSVLVELLSHGNVVDQGYWQSTTNNLIYNQLVVPLSQNATVFDSCRITITGGDASTGCNGAIEHTEFKVDHLQLLYSNSQSCIDSTHLCDTCICNGPYQPVCGCNGVTYTNICAAYNAGVNSWSSGGCNSNGCTDSTRVCSSCICSQIYAPVCGCNGITYPNSCYAANAGVLFWTTGACINNGCSASFNYVSDSTGFAADFYDASSGTYDSLTWNFGDGDSVTTGLFQIHHNYSTAGLYNVCLTIFSRDSSCNSTWCQTIAVTHPGPCPDTAIISSGTSCGTDYNPVCGCNGITYNNPCEAFYHHGVTSWTTGACQIPPSLCQANYFYWLDSTGYTAYFEFSGGANGTIVNTAGTTLLWNFGDGTSDTGQLPVHRYTDTSVHTWYVCLTVTDSVDSCTNTFCDSVNVGNTVYGCNAGFGYTVDANGVVTLYPDSSNGGGSTGNGWIIGADTTNGTPSFQIDSNSSYNICNVVYNSITHCTDTVCINAHEMYLAHEAAGVHNITGNISQVYLYPNPTANNSELKFTSTGGVADITVLNILGEVVYQRPQLRLGAGPQIYVLNLEGFNGGVYLVEIRLNTTIMVVKKLVKM